MEDARVTSFNYFQRHIDSDRKLTVILFCDGEEDKCRGNKNEIGRRGKEGKWSVLADTRCASTTLLRLYGISTSERRTMAQICGLVSWIFSMRGGPSWNWPEMLPAAVYFFIFLSSFILFPVSLYFVPRARCDRQVPIRLICHAIYIDRYFN